MKVREHSSFAYFEDWHIRGRLGCGLRGLRGGFSPFFNSTVTVSLAHFIKKLEGSLDVSRSGFDECLVWQAELAIAAHNTAHNKDEHLPDELHGESVSCKLRTVLI